MAILQEHKSVMYRMYGMAISPKEPTFGAGAKFGDAAIAEKDN
jgi:hypothetical protein